VVNPQAIVARERSALAAHQASLRGGALPPPRDAPRGTFVHGLLLPLSLLVATLRNRDLRRPYLRLFAVRGALLAVFAVLTLASGNADKAPEKGVNLYYDGNKVRTDDPDDDGDDDKTTPPVNVDMPGLHVHLDEKTGAGDVSVLGQKVPVKTVGGPPAAPAVPPPALTRWEAVRESAKRGWKQVVAFVGLLSVAEGVIVFFSRRWDDWLSFHVSALAGIRPESAEPPARKLAFDLKWIWRKLRRRIRGYVIFGSGMPLLYLLTLVPGVGGWLFGIAATLWAWYWIGVFTASKSAHAWADEGVAPPPLLVRSFNAPFSRGWWWWPLRVYGRLWARVVRGVNSAAAAFDRSPAPFLGLALARAILALPWLYLLARPIVPVAAGRLCAEADPADRFVTGPPARPQDALGPPAALTP
jgi:hypothetical protein